MSLGLTEILQKTRNYRLELNNTMKTKEYRVTLSLNFDIDATSEEAARDIANTQAMEWLGALDCVSDDEITIKETKPQPYCTAQVGSNLCTNTEYKNGYCKKHYKEFTCSDCKSDDKGLTESHTGKLLCDDCWI